MHTYALEAIGLKRVKIGKAADVFTRANDLQIGCPVELRLIATTPVDIERALHRQLRPFRVHGEWFELTSASHTIIRSNMESVRMPSPKQSLSSRDPSTKSVAVRLPAELANAVEAFCQQNGVSASELLRDLVAQWAYGSSQLAGPDAGYSQGRALAAQLAHAALRQALASLPEDHEAAATMLKGYYSDLAGARKR